VPIVQTGGGKISYWIGRKGLLEGRENILFIHGAGGGQYTWSYQKAFFEMQFNPIIVELPGHGESEGEGEQEIVRYAGHIHTFLKILDLHNVFLIGHSMGGCIVQILALNQPKIIKGIVLVGTGARLKVNPVILDGIKNNFEETVQKINHFAYSQQAPSNLIKMGIFSMRQCRSEVLYGDFSACDRFDITSEVEKIDLPTLILCGNDDQLTPSKYSEFLHSRIRGSKLEIFPKAGHMVMMESPQVFNEKIKQFIENVKGF
jgi:pimeloyl-ACP methyl ester carboxylesterase